MPPKPFNKEVLSFHIPLGRHVITPDTCILGAFPLIFHPPPREPTLARDREEDCREMDSTKKNIKTRVTACKSMVHTDRRGNIWKSHEIPNRLAILHPPSIDIFWTTLFWKRVGWLSSAHNPQKLGKGTPVKFHFQVTGEWKPEILLVTLKWLNPSRMGCVHSLICHGLLFANEHYPVSIFLHFFNQNF